MTPPPQGLRREADPAPAPARRALAPSPAAVPPPAAPIDLGLARLFRRAAVPGPALRVGVLLDGPTTIRCFRAVLEDVLACDFATLAVVVVNAAAPPSRAGAPASPLLRAWRHLAQPASRRRLAYALYERWWDRADPATDPLAPTDVSDLIAGLPRLEVVPLVSRHVHRFPEDALARLRAFDLDVAVRFGFNILRGPVLELPRHGIWSYHHGDPAHYRGGPPGWWELSERRRTTGAMLQRLTEELDAGLVLARGRYPTTTTASLAANRLVPYWSSQHFVIEKLRELHAEGWRRVAARAAPAPDYEGRRRPYRAPGNAEVLAWAGREVLRRGARRARHAPSETDWYVALRRAPVALPDSPAARPLADFRFLPNPSGGFLADPFLLRRGGRTWLFVERLLFADRRGTIACGEVAPDGSVPTLETCLERPYHLSYPHVFAHDGEVFMVPESEAAGVVELWRAVAFPQRWARECTLLELRAVDATPFRHDGRWWMFATHTAVRGHGASTALFVADALTGPWRPHPAGTVSADVRGARGAGAVLRVGERLLRPSQDCAKHYGHALVLNEIVTLDEREYAERPLRRFEHEWPGRCDGVHHWHRAGDWEAIDARGQRRLAR